MHTITGGVTNGVEYSCMYDPNSINFECEKEVNGKKLYGMYGIAVELNDTQSIVWFDENMNFVEGEVLKKCVNCTHCGRSGGGFFAECLCFGFQINDEYEHSCDEFACKSIRA